MRLSDNRNVVGHFITIARKVPCACLKLSFFASNMSLLNSKMQTLIELEETDANCDIIFILPHDLTLPHHIPSNRYGLIYIPLITYMNIFAVPLPVVPYLPCRYHYFIQLFIRYPLCLIFRAVILFYSVIYVVLLISAFNSPYS